MLTSTYLGPKSTPPQIVSLSLNKNCYNFLLVPCRGVIVVVYLTLDINKPKSRSNESSHLYQQNKHTPLCMETVEYKE
jgi:hypothetical protein